MHRVTLYYMPKETLTVRVETETREALDAIAQALDRDRSHVFNEALAAYVDIHQWQVEHIRQGLREADSGNTLPPWPAMSPLCIAAAGV